MTIETLNSRLWENIDLLLESKLFIKQTNYHQKKLGSDLWRSIFEKVNDMNLADFFEIMDNLSIFNPEYVNSYITSPCTIQICVFDVKFHNGYIYFAIYYSYNNKLSNICINNGFSYSTLKNIWVKKIDSAPDDMSGIQQGFGDFIKDVNEICHILINRQTQIKYFNLGF